MKYYFTILLMSMQSVLFGQCLLLNVNIADCSSCYNNIIYVDRKVTHIPTFAVFKEEWKVDSADIQQRFKYKELGIEMLFNDDLYSKTFLADNTTSICYYTTNGEIAWKKNLKMITQKFVSDSIINKKKTNAYNEYCVRKYHNHKVYSFNYGIGTLRIYDEHQKPIASIHSTDFNFDILAKNLQSNERELLESKGKMVNTTSRNYSPKYTWFDVDNSGKIYLLYEYVNFIDNQFKEAAKKYCIAVYSNQYELIDIYPIDLTDDASIFNTMFMVIANSNLIILTHNIKSFKEVLKGNPDKRVPFISVFTLQDHQYRLKNTDTFRLPPIYRNKYQENYLSLNYSSYPFVCFYVSNEIYNLKNGKMTYLVDTQMYKKALNNRDSDDVDAEPLHII